MTGKLGILARFSLCLLLAFDLMSNTKAHSHFQRSSLTTRSDSQCQPFQSNLGPSSVSSDGSKDFVAISPSGSYSTSGSGLELYLKKPKGAITTKDGVNDKIGDGATINSTFTLRYGKVTIAMSGPAVSGVVTAAILIADQNDEIDVELVGGDPTHWQTNVYAPSPEDTQPLWGAFGEIEDYPNGGTLDEYHQYTIDWNAERIVWSVDSTDVRTLRKGGVWSALQGLFVNTRLHRCIDQTQKNGALHFPSHATRIQLGIWDASSPAGTAQWAKGPIDWTTAPSKMTANFKSIVVECPY
ncbi:hypothetical protein POSPLDRAFT_95351 [Postia placenta Mad-698-R]|uniref:Glycoside hydrolase family 16 protein n=1 Tax=Postia placenta MAD-698-R-SB12 TaxID=670580 RepID=A0A1X6N5V4_9APHY|nr:glycoside hydrolase family 16 protein [Postia placenta MAD-698-R-SB12]EED80677.1 hypothetical protein POSPLDRAFT_95351 [Postia placenta Mad-698-R]OSX63852.1 glycoside hydrolase family 16 protein [Postia placenta MAD-698-R-SB12]